MVSERGAPGERDLQIYAAVRIDGRRQVDVAAEFGISQGRVSQIVRRVQRWRVAMAPAAEFERRDQQQIQRWLDDQRLEKLYEEAMELYRQSCQPRRKERRGKRGQEEWSTEAIDHGPGNVQCLKLAARLIQMRREDELARPSSPVSIEGADEEALFRRLCDLRVRAEMRGNVAATAAAPADLVGELLDNLLGTRRHEPRRMTEEEFDFAAREEGVDAVGQDLSCQVAERQDKSCPTSTNTPAIINDISAGKGSEADGVCDVTTSAAASCGEDSKQAIAAGAANNRQIFSSSCDDDSAARSSGSLCRALRCDPAEFTTARPQLASAGSHSRDETVRWDADLAEDPTLRTSPPCHSTSSIRAG
jgi:hypothetical protein